MIFSYIHDVSTKLKRLCNPFSENIIEFYCDEELYDVIPKPEKASKNIPDWFRNLESTTEKYDKEIRGDITRDDFGNVNMTAKRCLPMLDAMSLGYTIPLVADVHIQSNRNNTQLKITCSPGFRSCSHHDAAQLGGRNNLGISHGDALKFENPWIIRTAPGWSCLFIPPLNHFDNSFTCLSGLVDTDVYPAEVNFPAVLNVYDADLHIRAGTPLVTVIPIKRNSSSKNAPIRKMNQEDLMRRHNIRRTQSMRTHYYTKTLRKRSH